MQQPPLCVYMQQYCEPFFEAVDRWRRYSNFALILNRIQLIETAGKALIDCSSTNPTCSQFELAYENPSCSLLPEKVPTAGRESINGGDVIAFEAAKRLVPQAVFSKGGVFFQNCILKPLSNLAKHSSCSSSSEPTEPAPSSSTPALTPTLAFRSIVRAIEVLLLLPEEAGEATLLYRPPSGSLAEASGELGPPRPCPCQPVSLLGSTFAHLLRDSATAPPSSPSTSLLSSTRPKQVDAARKPHSGRKRRAPSTSSAVWTTNHESVGQKVAAYFAVATDSHEHTRQQLFFGEVASFAPPTRSKARDQLYHIAWEDGDEEDYDEAQLQQGRAQYDAAMGWTKNHPKVGSKVAAYFAVAADHDEKGVRHAEDRRLFQGVVTKYSPATGPATDDQLYHVVWEDGDEEDYDETQLRQAMDLYVLSFDTVWTVDHALVGSTVAAYFAVGDAQTLFTGRVTKFSPATAEGAKDQLYHIVWEDGDEEDYDERQLKAGRRLALATQKPAALPARQRRRM